MIGKILRNLVFAYLLYRAFAVGFNEIGSINQLLDHKRDKKIDISKYKFRKMFPYKDRQIPLPEEWKIDVYFDGTIFKKTYVLAIIYYIEYFIISVLYALLFVYYLLDNQTVYVPLFWIMASMIVISGVIIGIIKAIEEKKFVKRNKTEGMNFKL